MNNLTVRSSQGPYTVRFDHPFAGLEDGLAERAHLLIDARVADLYGGALAKALAAPSVLRIEATERSKSFEQFPAYMTHLLDHGVRREHTLVAVGGGVIQDITAFLAATLLRGLPWRFYPTTLLAQADSCIGSKSSVNVDRYKNQVGTFTPPRDVVISTEVLATLDEVAVRSGLGEMIKVHLIAGWEQTRAIARDYAKIFQDSQLMAHYIHRSLEIKRVKVEADEFDLGERLVMNYGHTFGHAIESATEYAIPHGIAVSLGMDMANQLSRRFGFISEEVEEELHALLRLNYAGFDRVPVPEEPFFAALSKDKKRAGPDVALILMRGPGEVFHARYPFDGALRQMIQETLQSVAHPAEADVW